MVKKNLTITQKGKLPNLNWNILLLAFSTFPFVFTSNLRLTHEFTQWLRIKKQVINLINRLKSESSSQFFSIIHVHLHALLILVRFAKLRWWLVYIYYWHYVKSVGIRSYSGLHFPAFGLNADRCGVSLSI